MTDWKNYYEKHKVRKVRPQLVKAVSFCKEKINALDLGAGTLVESVYLLEQGFNVTAIDSSPETKKFAEGLDSDKFELIITQFNDFDLKENNYDLVNAQYALPFHGPVGFLDFINKIIKSLKKDGLFVGQFFGIKDSWNTKESILVFHTKEDVLEMLNGLETIEFIEEEKDGPSASGVQKHWHVFHFIAKKI